MCVFFGPEAGLADAAGPVARRSREGKRLKGPPGQTRGGGRGRGQWWKRNRGKRGGDVGGTGKLATLRCRHWGKNFEVFACSTVCPAINVLLGIKTKMEEE